MTSNKHLYLCEVIELPYTWCARLLSSERGGIWANLTSILPRRISKTISNGSKFHIIRRSMPFELHENFNMNVWFGHYQWKSKFRCNLKWEHRPPLPQSQQIVLSVDFYLSLNQWHASFDLRNNIISPIYSKSLCTLRPPKDRCLELRASTNNSLPLWIITYLQMFFLFVGWSI